MDEPKLPQIPRKRAVIAIAAYLFLVALSFILLRHNQILLLVSLGLSLVLIASIYYKRKCPSCGSFLRFRKDYLPQPSQKFRCLFECGNCGKVWDRGDIGDDGVS